MGTYTLLLAVVIITIMTVIVIMKNNYESFASKTEKANAILQWKNIKGKTRYEDYRNTIGGDIVEYADVIALDNPTLDLIYKII